MLVITKHCSLLECAPLNPLLYTQCKLHFAVTKSSEHCYMAEVLYSMYRDPQNSLYLTFFKSVLGEEQFKAFEGE